MTDVTIKALASEIQTSVDRLIQQFADAGIRKSADDSVTAQEKQTLFTVQVRQQSLFLLRGHRIISRFADACVSKLLYQAIHRGLNL